jgi:hypothetical protein
MTTVQTDVPQHMRALNQANRVRRARAALKRSVADGSKTVTEIILDPPWEAASMTIGELLMSQHRWASARVRRFLSPIPMSEAKTVGSLTDRQRRDLVARLNGDVVFDPFDHVRMPDVEWRQAPTPEEAPDPFAGVPIRHRPAA